MRNSILIIATVVFGLLNVNANNLKKNGNSETSVEITRRTNVRNKIRTEQKPGFRQTNY